MDAPPPTLVKLCVNDDGYGALSSNGEEDLSKLNWSNDTLHVKLFQSQEWWTVSETQLNDCLMLSRKTVAKHETLTHLVLDRDASTLKLFQCIIDLFNLYFHKHSKSTLSNII